MASSTPSPVASRLLPLTLSSITSKLNPTTSSPLKTSAEKSGLLFLNSKTYLLRNNLQKFFENLKVFNIEIALKKSKINVAAVKLRVAGLSF